MNTNERTVIGVFLDPERARCAIAELVDAGFSKDRIGVLARNDKGKAEVKTVDDAASSKVGVGAAVGAVAGAGGGALWALGIAAGVLPPLGPVIAGGMLAAVLASAAGGAAAGSLVGALVGLGVPDEDAKYYDEQFRQGRTIVVVEPGDRGAEALAILRGQGSYDRSTEMPPFAQGDTRREPQYMSRNDL